MAAVAAPELNFHSAATTPYASAPSSPRGNDGYFMSAPGSPSRAIHGHSSSAIPFFWEEIPGTPKHSNSEDPIDFAFEFRSGQLPTDTGIVAAADELFDHGVIRPLKPPPRLQVAESSAGAIGTSPKSPKSPKALFQSPKGRTKREDFDPFEKAIQETTRGRGTTTARSAEGRRAARSLSPLRGVFGFPWKTSAVSGGGDNATGGGGSWKWKWKELFLFRSKSEGRVTGNQHGDVLGKYTAEARITTRTAAVEDTRNSSFRSTDSLGSARRVVTRDTAGSIGGSSRRGVSAHELHYTKKRAVAEEQKKKTFLPYRQGLLDCLGFSPTLPINDLAKSLGSIARHRS